MADAIGSTLMMEGFLNVLKPPGMTSHDVVAFLRRTLGEKKIGHCGTLDPQAAGVLPICIGQATRLADYLSGGDKSYYCEMVTGYETDTQDVWGNVTWEAPEVAMQNHPLKEALLEVMQAFVGDIEQEVPAYSAVKREGKSLHRYAREGTLHTDIFRNVSIRSVEIIRVEPWRIGFVVECGSGTYVRMFCRDIGRKLGCGATMSFLLRLRVGPFRLDKSVTLEEIRARKDSGEPFRHMIAPKELALAGMPKIMVSAEEAAKLRHGQSVWLPTQGLSAQGLSAQSPFVQGLSARGLPACGLPVQGIPVNSLSAKHLSDGDRAWASDPGQRLVALGHVAQAHEALGHVTLGHEASAGGRSGSRYGQVLFHPEKVFADPND
jgi:tRNA pseudouridine55 synthase